MIGIDMELPRNLGECRFKIVSKKQVCCLITGNVREIDGTTQMDFLSMPVCSNCPIFQIDKLSEDMSWEELFKKYKKDIELNDWFTFVYVISPESIFKISCYQKTGRIKINFTYCELEYTILDKFSQKPFQMYQIIKLLIGDQK